MRFHMFFHMPQRGGPLPLRYTIKKFNAEVPAEKSLTTSPSLQSHCCSGNRSSPRCKSRWITTHPPSKKRLFVSLRRIYHLQMLSLSLRLWSTWSCRGLFPTTHRIRCSRMDCSFVLSPLVLRRLYWCGPQKMLVLLFFVLLSRPNIL